jgi:hypothetical protein
MATTKKTLAEALVQVQKDLPPIEKNGINPHFKSAFVTLDHLLAKALPVLNKHGIALLQFPSESESGPSLTTILQHESGEGVEYTAPLLLAKNDPQGQGSAITYMRRYALAAALGVSSEADDDGNAATEGVSKAARQEPKKADAMTAKQQEAKTKFLALLKSHGITAKKEVLAKTSELLERDVTQEPVKPDEWAKAHDDLKFEIAEAEAAK